MAEIELFSTDDWITFNCSLNEPFFIPKMVNQAFENILKFRAKKIVMSDEIKCRFTSFPLNRITERNLFLSFTLVTKKCSCFCFMFFRNTIKGDYAFNLVYIIRVLVWQAEWMNENSLSFAIHCTMVSQDKYWNVTCSLYSIVPCGEIPKVQLIDYNSKYVDLKSDTKTRGD